jgi:predicted MFS family arabinose efflux permease
LGPKASFWVSAGVVAHTLWTSAAPAMTYPLYASLWRLTPTVTTAIFAIYPVVVVSVLCVFGDISDVIGRRATMLLGLGASILGVGLFAVAPNVGWLFVGRALMGVGVGLSAGPSAAAVVEFNEGGAKRATAVTAVAQALGMALALLVGGALIEYAPFPTRLSFWVLFAVLVALFSVTWFLPRPARLPTGRRWRPRALTLPASVRVTFLVSALAVTTAYTLGAVFVALGAQAARDVVGSRNVFVNGAALSLFAIVSGVVSVVARSAPSRVLLAAGGVVSMAAMGLFALSASFQSLLLFLAAAAGSGLGYSLLFLGGLDRINAAAPPESRGGTLSTLFLVAYLSMGSIMFLLGLLATAGGWNTALDTGAAALAVMSALTLILTLMEAKPADR